MTNYPEAMHADLRADGRGDGDLRPVRLHADFTRYAEGSILIEVGRTRVLCNATVEERVPAFLKGKGVGWVTAEYAMLPRATDTRTARETGRGGLSGRTHEIQRLVGRSLRAVVDLAALGERSVMIDCDVIEANGGTRTAAITGGFTALALALNREMAAGRLTRPPLRDFVAAVSVGLVGGRVLLDLDYGEDSRAEVDLNVVGTGDGRLVEVQGTAETEPFDRAQLEAMLDAAASGIRGLVAHQRTALTLAMPDAPLRALMEKDPSRGRISWKEDAS